MTTQSKASGAKPTHRIYVVTGEGNQAFWKETGSAWPNRHGKGFSIACDALSIDGKIVMREARLRPAPEEAR